MKTRIIMAAVLSLATVGTAESQPRGPFVVSPEVNADKTVTFRYLAPLAKSVKLNASQFVKSPVDMARDSIGIWTVTVGPVRPDIYPYSFSVDGVTVMDPSNVSY